jgi:hypothetical protein
MSRKEQDMKIVRDFEITHQREPFDLHEVYHWAKSNNLWYAPKDLEEKKFVEEFAQVLREEYITADDGSKVRYYYAVTQGRQGSLWGNWETASREHIAESLKQKRHQSLADCRQTKNDMDFVNRKRFQVNPIQMSFNFDADLAEEEAYKEMKHKSKSA